MRNLNQVIGMTDKYFEKNCLKCKFYYTDGHENFCVYPMTNDKCRKKTFSWKLGQLFGLGVLALIFIFVCCAMYGIGQFFMHLF